MLLRVHLGFGAGTMYWSAILSFISTPWPATFAIVRACIPENVKFLASDVPFCVVPFPWF